jgi:uncharacterized membrane protein
MSPRTLFDRLRTGFLQGMALIAPLAITLAFLVWLGRALEAFFGGLLRGILPADWVFPGLGLGVGLSMTVAVGLTANLFLVRWLVRLAERLLDRIPLVKSLFQGIKDVAQLFAGQAGQGDRDLGRVVAVEVGGAHLVGFVTQEHADLPGAVPGRDGGRVAVYLPMSYQLGGYTLYLDRERVVPLDAGAEQAMRAVLTGGALRGHGGPDGAASGMAGDVSRDDPPRATGAGRQSEPR